MAILKPGLQFTGTIGNLTAYEMKGTGKIIIRTKGGPTREQVKKGKNFVRTRENNMEMGGRSRAAKWVRHAMGGIARLADHQLGNALHPLIKEIQYRDIISPRGQRNISFSAAPGVLPGFQVNNRFGLEALLRSPVSFEIDAATRSARLQLPGIKAGVNLFLPSYAVMFGMEACLGLVPDVLYTINGYMPNDFNIPCAGMQTPWYAASGGCNEQELVLQLPPPGSAGTWSIILSFGIRLGKPAEGDTVQQYKYAGAGKILGIVTAGN